MLAVARKILGAETARALGISENAAKIRLHCARLALTEILKDRIRD